MKKLMYLFVAATMFAFTACGGGETATEETTETVVEETVVEEAVNEDTTAAVKDTTAITEEAEVTEEVTE